VDVEDIKIESSIENTSDMLRFEIDRIENYYKIIALVGALMFGLGLII
jgi:hypothetical protein